MNRLYECERCQLHMGPEEAHHTFEDCIDALKDCIDALKDCIDALKAENAQLREALERYGWHTEACLDNCANTRSGNCTCGLSAAMEEAQG